jgi:hypothetical protein
MGCNRLDAKILHPECQISVEAVVELAMFYKPSTREY